MPRNRPRKTNKGADQGSYSRDVVTQAVDDVKNGNRSIRAAAQFYSIPRTTLRHYVNGTRGKGIISQGGLGGGGKTQLTLDCEDQLAKCLRILERWGFGLCRDEVLDLVQAFVKTNELRTKFKDGRPGKDWFIGFKKRHNLSIKKPQGVEYVRMSAVNPYTVFGFFDLLEKVVKENNLEGKPDRFYNCDETAFSTDPSKTKVVGAKGEACTRTISSSGRENTTVLVTTSAAGKKLPILCVFKGKNILESWVNEESNRVSYAATKRGWMDGEIFSMWFKKVFIPNIPPERPVVLLFDGHVSHITLELIETAIANSIILVKLPPHTTHVLQPLDVAVFKSMKTAWDRKLTQWQREHPRRKIPHNEFVKILTSVFEETPIINIINGFQATGIYNPELKGPDRKRAELNCKFKPSDLAAYHLSQQNKSPNNLTVSSEITQANENQVAVESNSRETTEYQPSSATTADHANEPSTSSLKIPLETVRLESDHIRVTQSKAPTTIPQQTETVVQKSPEKKNFEDIIIDMFQSKKGNSSVPVNQGRKRLSTGAEILTSNEAIEKKRARLKADQQKAEKKLQLQIKKQENAKRKAAFKSKEDAPKCLPKKKQRLAAELEEDGSSDSSSNSYSVHDSDSDEHLDDPIAVIKDDFVLVDYLGNRYPGQVMDVRNGTVQIKHMQSAGEFNWKWPETDDILWYEEHEILKIIQPPKMINKRGIYSVEGAKGFYYT